MLSAHDSHHMCVDLNKTRFTQPVYSDNMSSQDGQCFLLMICKEYDLVYLAASPALSTIGDQGFLACSLASRRHSVCLV